MPTISHFYGITIVMYLSGKEHNPPHIHAITQDDVAVFQIATGKIMQGKFPAKAAQLVEEFIVANREELNRMWETGEYKKLPPLE